MTAKWDGIKLVDVYEEWLDGMQYLTLGAINHGIEQSKLCEHPPSMGEFIKHCKGYKPPELLKIESKLTPEQIEANKRRIREIANTLLRNKKC